MTINITEHTADLTPALRDYIEKRMQGLSKFTAGEPTVVVEIGKTTEHHRQGEVFEAKVHGIFAVIVEDYDKLIFLFE
mgnify:CR=1 FL=1